MDKVFRHFSAKGEKCRFRTSRKVRGLVLVREMQGLRRRDLLMSADRISHPNGRMDA
jgi:hypothetical protein